MACGFGAVTLLFLILRHNANEIPIADERLSSEISLLQQDIEQAEQDKVKALNSLEKIELTLVKTQGLSKRVITELAEKEKSIQEDPNNIDILRRQVKQLEDETSQIEEVEFGDKVREFVGDGNRQYLTGLTLGGERVLILIDGSASMLADTVVNTLRRRNMDDPQKQQSAKWQWSLRTLEWLLAQLPPSSRFQVYVFNNETRTMLAGTEGEWLDASDSLALERVMASAGKYVPSAGTSLSKAIGSISDFDSKPDNLFILTDGLPTLGDSAPKKYMVTGKQRRNHFEAAISKLPRGIPVNTILFPMEGDPEAAALFWQLALDTRGAFIAPSRDWP
tara:strand:- start:233 stop:1237 length:1005 start_codon:yes stop_codon:yes gene_type:complete